MGTLSQNSLLLALTMSLLAHASLLGVLSRGNRIYRSSGSGEAIEVSTVASAVPSPAGEKVRHVHRIARLKSLPDPGQRLSDEGEQSESPLSGGPAGASAGSPAPGPVFGEEEVDRPARLLHMPKLRYPESELRRGVEGEVELLLILDERGKVVSAEISRGDGRGFDAAALDVARQLTFVPAEKGGRAVAVHVHWICHFRIDD